MVELMLVENCDVVDLRRKNGADLCVNLSDPLREYSDQVVNKKKKSVGGNLHGHSWASLRENPIE